MKTRKNSIKLVLIVLVCALTLFSKAQTEIVGGDVYGTWQKSNSPYNINGDITIPNDSTLTIESGVQVVFKGLYKLDVKGTLKAVGLVSDIIVFTVSDTSGYYDNTDTGWKGIWFDQTLASNDSSELVNCIIEYGKSEGTGPSGSPEKCGGGLYIWGFSKIYIDGLEVRYCRALFMGGGIYIVNQQPGIGVTLLNSKIHDNTITDCCWAGGLSLQGDINILGCQITDNIAGIGGGLYMNWGGDLYIGSSIIANNSCNGYGGGIHITDVDNTFLENNIISNNSAINKGGGVYLELTNSYFLNNTIVNNLSTDAGGGIYSETNVSYSDTVINTILWGNVATNFDSSLYGDIVVAYSDVADGHIGVANINSDPLFVEPSAGVGAEYDGLVAQWQLQASSPCINSGNPEMSYNETDLSGFPRVDCVSDTIDIGAYEFVPEDVMPTVEGATVHISEDADNNSIVHTVVGTNILYFKILEGNSDNAFSMDSLTGIIKVNNNQVLDYDTNPFYELIIRGYNNCAFSDNVITIIIDESTVNSIEISDLKDNIIYYSNPAKDYLTIKLSDNHNFKSITLFSSDGRKVKENSINGNFIKVDVIDLESGVYIIMLKNEHKQFVTKKILIE